MPITNEFTFQPNYSIYQSQIKIPSQYEDCPTGDSAAGTDQLEPGDSIRRPDVRHVDDQPTSTDNCLTNGEASVAFKAAAAQGAILTSALGYSLIWDSIDDRKNPSSGIYANFHQDIAGLGGQSHFLRETFDGKYYLSDHRRPHRRRPSAGRPDQPDRRRRSAADRQLQPRADAGARLRAGRHGPARHSAIRHNLAGNGLGGTTYFGGSAEIQFPIFGLPKEVGLKGALFADAGTLFGFQGQTNYSSLWGLSAYDRLLATNSI